MASIAAHYQLQIPVSRIRQYAGTDKRGTNVLGLIEAAEKLGFQAKGAKGALDSLSKIPLPAIAHVILKNGLHHFVVIYKVTKKDITFMDPADGGYHKNKIAEFEKDWSGVIVLILPDESFSKRNETTSNTKRFWQLLMPHKGIMIQALVGALVYTILGLSTSIYMQKLIDFVLPDGNIRLLNLLSIGMIVILVFQVFIGTFKTILGLQTGQQIDARLILGYYKHLLKLPQRFFDTMRVGEITSRINDAVKIRMFINDVALSMIVNVLIVGFSIALMFLYYWKLAVIMLCIIPIYIIIYWISNKVNKKWLRTLMENSAELETQLVESISTAGTIKRFGIEEYANNKTENKFYTLLNSIYKSGIKGLYLGTTADFITRLFTILILWAGAYFVINRELTPGELLSFYALIGYFTGPASSLIGANKSIQDALIAADRLFEIIDLEIESSDLNKVELTSAEYRWNPGNSSITLTGGIGLAGDTVDVYIENGEYSVSDTGAITFTTAPAQSSTITSYQFSKHDVQDIDRAQYDVVAKLSITANTDDYYQYNQLTNGVVKLNRPAVDAQYVWVCLNGEWLAPSIDYSVSNNQMYLKISRTLSQNDEIDVIHFTAPSFVGKIRIRLSSPLEPFCNTVVK